MKIFLWCRIDTSAPKNKNKVTVLPLQTAIPAVKDPLVHGCDRALLRVDPQEGHQAAAESVLEKELKQFEQSKPTAAQLEAVIKSLRAK
jgi:hypothetical protein